MVAVERKPVVDELEKEEKHQQLHGSEKSEKMEIVWTNIIRFTILHIIGFTGVYCCFLADRKTLWWHLGYYFLSAMGITAGAHRLWSHRSYKANSLLRALLACFGSMAYENSIYEWVRDHRVHHKYTDTNADPHNSTRGFFFSHIGWLLVRKHPDVITKGKGLSLDDLHQDKIVMFQHKHKYLFMAIFTFVLPSVIPWYYWNESLMSSYLINVFRYCCVLHATWAVNSFAHMFGDKPYDKSINPSENSWVAFFAAGEGFHNYHHVFPSDYSTSEYGFKLNMTSVFIKLMQKCGCASDLKEISPQMIAARKARTGDGC